MLDNFPLGASYFYHLPSETTPEWQRPFMDVDQRILRYQAVLMENPGLTLVRCLTQIPSCLPLRALSTLTLA